MPTSALFHEVISGRRQGLLGNLLRGLLRVAETPYTWAVTRRNNAFDTGRLPIERLDVPVFSVGNLTVGGTGKTPLVAWLVRQLLAIGRRPAIISRGYGRSSHAAALGRQNDELNDEGRELALLLPGIPQIQQADRVAAGRRAIAEHQVDSLVLDDAFQHRRLDRDVDIVLLDALEPFGYDHLLPRGLLREPLASLRRADVLVLSRADLVDRDRRERIRRRACEFAPEAVWAEVAHRPVELVSCDGVTRPLPWLDGRATLAFCGIGNPAGFRGTLEQLGVSIADFRTFPDHCSYAPAEFRSLTEWARQHPSATAIVCTRKDLVKLPHDSIGNLPLMALQVEVDFLTDPGPLVRMINHRVTEDTEKHGEF